MTLDLEPYLPFPPHSEGNRLILEMIEEYGVIPEIGVYASKLLHQFARGTGALTERGDLNRERIATQKILDIGCGSGNVFQTDVFRNDPMARKSEPWLCRLLSEMGADVTGIDKSLPTRSFRLNARAKGKWAAGQPLKVESGWQIAKRDMTKTGAIDAQTFPSDSFDTVFCRGFVGDPRFGRDDPQMAKLRFEEPAKYAAAVREIETQSRRVLKPTGCLIWNDQLFVPSRENGFELVTRLHIEGDEADDASTEQENAIPIDPKTLLVTAFAYFDRDTLSFTEILDIAVMSVWQQPTQPPTDLTRRMIPNVQGMLEKMQREGLILISENPGGEPLITIQVQAFQ